MESFVAINCNLSFHKEIFRPPGKQKKCLEKESGLHLSSVSGIPLLPGFSKGLIDGSAKSCVAFLLD